MEEQASHPRYPANWGVRFLCDCRKNNKGMTLHTGVAQEISMHWMCLLSDHQICQQKKIAMQLMLPSLLDGAPQKIIKIIGRSIVTPLMKEGSFLTKIDFLLFEEGGLKKLERHLRENSGANFFALPPASEKLRNRGRHELYH